MANELQTQGPATGVTVYFEIRNSTGSIWNGSAFQAYLTANYALFPILATEQGAASNFYAATFPAAIPAGIYSIVAKQRTGVSPAETDPTVAAGNFDWTGTAPTTLSDAATSGQVGQFAPIRLARGVALLSGFPFYLKSAADHVTPIVSGICSGQINRDGTGWTTFQSGSFTELGNGFYLLNSITSGDINCSQAAVLFTGTNVSGASVSDPLPISLILQKTSGG